MNSVKLGFSVLLLLGASACAENPPPQPAAPPSGPDLQISDEAQGEDEPPPPPSVPQPTTAPAPPSAPPPPPSETSQSAPPPQPAATAPAPPAVQPAPVVQAEATGQWTYTTQYGWIWMPYAQQYTYVSPDGGAAYEYAYYPNGGWRWVYAPWVLGWGPSPYWGHYGARHYVWYSHPWFRVGVVHRGPVYHRRWRRY